MVYKTRLRKGLVIKYRGGELEKIGGGYKKFRCLKGVGRKRFNSCLGGGVNVESAQFIKILEN